MRGDGHKGDGPFESYSQFKVKKHQSYSYVDRTPHAQVQSIHLPDGLISAVSSFQREMRLEQSVRDWYWEGWRYSILCPFFF